MPNILLKYKKEVSEFVDFLTLTHTRRKPRYILEDVIEKGALIRHDSKKLAKVLLSLI